MPTERRRHGRCAPGFVLPLMLVWAGSSLRAADLQPQPSLPPQPRPVQIEPSARARLTAGTRSADQAALGSDITALKAAMDRVRGELARGAAGAAGEGQAVAEWKQHDAQAVTGERVTDGPARASQPFGGDRLSVQRWQDGGADVTAAIDATGAETVLREICLLIGRHGDGIPFAAGRRSVSLHVKDMPWPDALDRLLGQVGLSWREDGSRRIEVVDPGATPPDAAQLERQAQRALVQAARGDSATAAEALYLMGVHEATLNRHIEAMKLYGNVVETFADAKDRAAQGWVLRAMHGIGDAMMALGQFQEARSVYRNYLGRAPADDTHLPAVHLAAAEAGRRLGLARQDAIAFDEAIDDLHSLLERFAKVPSAAAEVALARLAIGELLFDAGRWQEAETQLSLYAEAAGTPVHGAEGDGSRGTGGHDASGHGASASAGGAAGAAPPARAARQPPPDQISFWLAECAFELGRVDHARPIYERLVRAWKAGRTDPDAASDLYATSAYRIGLCHLRRGEPRFVHALFAFLRARQTFPRSAVDAELLINIARCYAELERDDESVTALWELLKSDALSDHRPGPLQLDQLVGELQGRLGDYAGPVRAKVLFYIAQANYRLAMRDRKERTAAATQAVGYYERVLGENPPVDLRQAARLGLARVALLAGQDDRGVQTLRELLRDPALSSRDREFAAQLLGSHFRDKGLLREAIKAFRGEVD